MSKLGSRKIILDPHVAHGEQTYVWQLLYTPLAVDAHCLGPLSALNDGNVPASYATMITQILQTLTNTQYPFTAMGPGKYKPIDTTVEQLSKARLLINNGGNSIYLVGVFVFG